MARAFFRGRIKSIPDFQAVNINPCREPPRVVSYTPLIAKTGTISVSGTAQKRIVFVFDCSLSMQEGGHLGQLRNVLKKVIQSLDPTDQVGLVVYGHRYQLAKTGSDSWQVTKVHPWPPEFGDPAFAPPSTEDKDFWDLAVGDYQMLVPLRPLRENKGDLIKRLDLLNPWGITPLLGAVDYASRESQLSKGGGAIVVITDGAPSDMGKNFRNKEAGFKAVAEDRAINLFIIGFNVDLAGEEKAKWESFRDLLATTPRVQKPVTNDPLKLTEEIERAIKPSQTVTVAMPSSDIGAVQTLLLNGPPVAITAGMYEVQYPNVLPWPVHIRGGEKIELKLRFDKGSTGEFE